MLLMGSEMTRFVLQVLVASWSPAALPLLPLECVWLISIQLLKEPFKRISVLNVKVGFHIKLTYI